jgi:NAD(P)-dependent dehydrogenase (short-subunit alcohol dehydrogenase family)
MSDGGTIILTGSDVSIRGFPSTSVYSATKAAVRSFARTWTTDLRDRAIRVNVVSPGPVDTPMAAATIARRPEDVQALTSQVSMGQPGLAACICRTKVDVRTGEPCMLWPRRPRASDPFLGCCVSPSPRKPDATEENAEGGAVGVRVGGGP